MACIFYLNNEHRDRYRISLFNIEHDLKELFKEALSYDKSLLIRANEEIIYKRFLFWKYKTNEIKIWYSIYHENLNNNGKSLDVAQVMSCASGDKEKVMSYLYGIINGYKHCSNKV